MVIYEYIILSFLFCFNFLYNVNTIILKFCELESKIEFEMESETKSAIESETESKTVLESNSETQPKTDAEIE